MCFSWNAFQLQKKTNLSRGLCKKRAKEMRNGLMSTKKCKESVMHVFSVPASRDVFLALWVSSPAHYLPPLWSSGKRAEANAGWASRKKRERYTDFSSKRDKNVIYMQKCYCSPRRSKGRPRERKEATGKERKWHFYSFGAKWYSHLLTSSLARSFARSLGNWNKKVIFPRSIQW